VSAALLVAALLGASPDFQAGVPGQARGSLAAPIDAGPPAEPAAWYGRPALIADAASISIWLGGLAIGHAGKDAQPGDALAAVGLVGYELGGPVLHWAHENHGRAVGSLALRTVAAIPGLFMAGLHETSACGEANAGPCPYTASDLAIVGLPFVAAAVLDDLLLARDGFPDRAPRPAAGATVTPVAGPGWALLSLRGAF
jgi:hypothetical protein